MKKVNLKQWLSLFLVVTLTLGLLGVQPKYAEASEVAELIINGSFEEESLSPWTTNESSAISVQGDNWTPANGGSKRLSYWDEAAFIADTSQVIRDLEAGSYILSAWVASGGAINEAYIYAETTEDHSKLEAPLSGNWINITQEIEVTGDELTIGIYADAEADAWITIDLVSLKKVVIPPVTGIAIPNYDFEDEGPTQMPAAWQERGAVEASFTEAGGAVGSGHALVHSSSSDYKITTYQTLSELDNGYYTLTAYTQNTGGQEAAYLFAQAPGASATKTSIPVSTSWKKVFVRGIQVTDGELTIGLTSDAKAGQTVRLDRLEMVQDDEPYELLKGGDVSQVSYVESMGGKFYDRQSVEKDVFQILKENGHDIVRLRLYNNPGKGNGDGTYYTAAGIMDKEDILKLARRAKDYDLQIQLTFHYSDFWSNGATQLIPSDWRAAIQHLDTDEQKIEKLTELVYEYTLDIMQAMEEQGTTPEFVSLGNEVQAGILFPYGRAASTTWVNLAGFYNAGYEAVKEVSPDTQVILHLDDAGNTDKYVTYFDNAELHGANYDIIGSSYYPFWTWLTVEQAAEFFNQIAARYGKKIMVMETGYNWNQTLPDGYTGQLWHNGPYSDDTSTPQGQKDFMINVFNALKSVDNGMVIGDLYWDPIFIEVPGVGWAYKESDDLADVNVVSNTTLFDFSGRALPVMDAYWHNGAATTNGLISGKVLGADGRGIAQASVSITTAEQTYVTKTDSNGNYLLVNIPAGTDYSITAEKNGYLTGTIDSIEVEAGMNHTGHNITVIGGSISGQVVDEQELPQAEAEVSVIYAEEVYSTTTDADGNYQLLDLPAAANHTVTAKKVGYASANVNEISVAHAENTNDVDLQITLASGTITGKVSNVNEQNVDGVLVSVTVDGQTYSALTDEDGDYTLVNVPSGQHTLYATKIEYMTGQVTGVAVSVGQVTTNIDFILQFNLGTVSGAIKDAAGAAISGATVRLTSSENGATYTTVTDEQGQYELQDVLAGARYDFIAAKEGYMNGERLAVMIEPQVVTPNIDLVLGTFIEIENNSFEATGEGIVGWQFTGTEGATFIQEHSEAVDGSKVLSSWMDANFQTDVYQTISGLQDGRYILSAYFYNGGDQREYYMYAKQNSAEQRLDISPSHGMIKHSLDIEVVGGELTIGFYSDALAGNWMLVDQVQLGYFGAVEEEENEEGNNGGNNGGNNSGNNGNEGSNPEAVQQIKLAQMLAETEDNELVIKLSGDAGKPITAAMDVEELRQATGRTILLTHQGVQLKLNVEQLLEQFTDQSGTLQLKLMTDQYAQSAQSNDKLRFQVSFELNDKELQVNRAGIEIKLPYKLAANEQPHQVILLAVDRTKRDIVVGAFYQNGEISFTLDDAEAYILAYQPVRLTDIEDLKWAREGIEALAARSMIKGYPDLSFKPQAAITRAEFVTLLVSVLELTRDETGVEFTDVASDAWYAEAVAIAASHGLINGKQNGAFAPNEEIQRQEMAVMLYRALAAAPANALDSDATRQWNDAEEIAEYAKQAVLGLSQLSIIQGNSQGMFKPSAPSTRAEAAVMLYRLLQYISFDN